MLALSIISKLHCRGWCCRLFASCGPSLTNHTFSRKGVSCNGLAAASGSRINIDHTDSSVRQFTFSRPQLNKRPIEPRSSKTPQEFVRVKSAAIHLTSSSLYNTIAARSEKFQKKLTAPTTFQEKTPFSVSCRSKQVIFTTIVDWFRFWWIKQRSRVEESMGRTDVEVGVDDIF